MTHSYIIEADRETLDLPLCVSSGQVFRWREVAPNHWVGVDGPHYFDVAIADSARHEPVRLRITSNAPEIEFRRLFRLEVPLSELQRQFVAAMPELAPMIQALPGLRLMAPSDPTEVFGCFMCTVNNHLRRIYAMVDRLAKRGPLLAEIGGVRLHRFPTMEQLAARSEEELRSEGFGYRGATIPRMARETLQRGEDWLCSLRTAPYPQAFAALNTLPGVGPKLADCVCLFGLHHTEAVPVDTHVWQAATHLVFPDLRGSVLTRRRYEAVGRLFRERCGKWAGWAHQYLFYHHLVNTRRTP